MAKPGDFAGQRADDVCIAADRLLIAIEDGGSLLSGYPEQLQRAVRVIERALVIHREKSEAEYRKYLEKARAA